MHVKRNCLLWSIKTTMGQKKSNEPPAQWTILNGKNMFERQRSSIIMDKKKYKTNKHKFTNVRFGHTRKYIYYVYNQSILTTIWFRCFFSGFLYVRRFIFVNNQAGICFPIFVYLPRRLQSSNTWLWFWKWTIYEWTYFSFKHNCFYGNFVCLIISIYARN